MRVPFPFRFVVSEYGLARAKMQITAKAKDKGLPTPLEAPKRYRYDGWGFIGVAVAVNVTYLGDFGEIDLGRYTLA